MLFFLAPHCTRLWDMGVGCWKPHFSFVSLHPVWFFQPEKQEEGARTCSSRCLLFLPLSPQWVCPSFFAHQLHHAPQMQQRWPGSTSPQPLTPPPGFPFSVLRTQDWHLLRRVHPGSPSLFRIPGLLTPLLLFDLQPREWNLLPEVTVSVTTVSLFSF